MAKNKSDKLKRYDNDNEERDNTLERIISYFQSDRGHELASRVVGLVER